MIKKETQAFFRRLLYLFALVFGLLCLFGAVLTATSVSVIGEKPTAIEANMDPSHVSFELTTGIPGVVILVLGAIGLITLLIKIPVKEVVQIIASDTDGEKGFAPASYEQIDKRIPLLLYFIFRRKLKTPKLK